VFEASGNLHDVISIISDHFAMFFYFIFNLCGYHQWTVAELYSLQFCFFLTKNSNFCCLISLERPHMGKIVLFVNGNHSVKPVKV